MKKKAKPLPQRAKVFVRARRAAAAVASTLQQGPGGGFFEYYIIRARGGDDDDDDDDRIGGGGGGHVVLRHALAYIHMYIHPPLQSGGGERASVSFAAAALRRRGLDPARANGLSGSSARVHAG